jgi:hypothetical protein
LPIPKYKPEGDLAFIKEKTKLEEKYIRNESVKMRKGIYKKAIFFILRMKTKMNMTEVMI